MERMDRILAEHAMKNTPDKEEKLYSSLPDHDYHDIADADQIVIMEKQTNSIEEEDEEDEDEPPNMAAVSTGSTLVSSDDFAEEDEEEGDIENRLIDVDAELDAMATTESNNSRRYEAPSRRTESGISAPIGSLSVSTSASPAESSVSEASSSPFTSSPASLPVTPTRQRSWERDEQQQQDDDDENYFPPTASPQLTRYKNEEYPPDMISSTRNSLDSNNIISSLSSSSLHLLDRHTMTLGDVQEEEDASEFSNGSQHATIAAATDDVTSSMDAFEASFAITTFPESFASNEKHVVDGGDFFRITRPESPSSMPTELNKRKKKLEIYDPFQNSPQTEMAPPLSNAFEPNEPLPQSLPLKWGTRARDRLRSMPPTTASIEKDAPGHLPGVMVRRDLMGSVDLSFEADGTIDEYQPTSASGLASTRSRLSPRFDKYRASSNGRTSPNYLGTTTVAMLGSTNCEMEKRPRDGVVRSILPSLQNKTSPRHYKPASGSFSLSPEAPPQTPEEHQERFDNSINSTPPSGNSSSSFQSDSSSNRSFSQRPHKSGYENARAKYERATQSRNGTAISNTVDFSTATTSLTTVNKSSLTKMNGLYSESTLANEPVEASKQIPVKPPEQGLIVSQLSGVSVKQRAAAFDSPTKAAKSNSAANGSSPYDSDGDIPLNTSISRSPTAARARDNDEPSLDEVSSNSSGVSMLTQRQSNVQSRLSQVTLRNEEAFEVAAAKVYGRSLGTK